MFDWFESKDSLIQEKVRLEKRIEELEQRLESSEDSYMDLAQSNNDLQNKVSEAELRIQDMLIYRDKTEYDRIANKAAEKIDALFVWYWETQRERTNAVQRVIKECLKMQDTGTV